MKRTTLLFFGTTLLVVSVIGIPAFVEAGSSNTFKPRSVGSALEVSITDDGSARVSGARVTSVSGNSFTAETIWGAGRLTWTVHTDASTSIFRKSGTGIDLVEITAGDYVSFTGSVLANQPPFTINATSIKDWSILDNHTSVTGPVIGISMNDSTLTLEVDSKKYIVSVTDATSFAQNGAQSLADLELGDRVTATGVASGKGTFTALKINVLERKAARENGRPTLMAGLGPWVEYLIPNFIMSRIP